MFQNELNTYVITKLNLNTQDIIFKGDYMFMMDNGKFVIETQNGYDITQTDYTPVQIEDWRSTVQPYKRIDLQDLVLPLSIAVRARELNEGLTAIDEFRTLLNGATDTIDGLNVGFRVGQPNPPSSPVTHNGEKWVLIQVIIMLSAGANLLYGNAIEFKMAKTTETLVELVYSAIDISVVNDTVTDVTEEIVSISNGKSTLSYEISVFYEDNVTLLDTLIDQLFQDEDANTKYDISIKYSATNTKTDTCLLTMITQHIENGIPIGFKMTMNKAT